MTSSLDKIKAELIEQGFDEKSVDLAYLKSTSVLEWIIHNKEMEEKQLHNYLKSILLDKLNT
ncbi:hypothetical protein [Virgibacillus halodenitrificans]|uniref:Uncharacterized protein n=1 Tax=Virgibacillus halodenitrificans TaxID=1482 RepID=A0ABR7VLH9_VIRHA|nr:hypothetical protein [Virgibacillus halodenitrificans]MBD1222775.1 hypothetical protein [Virgibacillus halodenitrificans]